MTERRLSSRRGFLKRGAAGIAGSALLAGGACSRASEPGSGRRGSFVYRTLGRTGLRLPVVSIGTCYGIEMIRAALDEGLVYVHTSSSYAERRHERLLGRALQGLSRDSFVIATSPDLAYEHERTSGRSADVGMRTAPAAIADSLDESLRRLGLDHVDIYYLPSVGSREVALHEPYLRAFEQFKKEGKTRFVGVATHSHEPEVIRAAVEGGVWDVALTAYNFRQSHRDEVRAAIGEAAAAGLGVVAMKTQAGVYWDRRRQRKIDMKAALKWVLRDENVHTTIPGFANFAEMHEDISIMEDLALSRREEQELQIGAALGLPGLYCQSCGSCLRQCSAGMDIPALMRGRMYALGHRDLRKARRTLRAWTPADVACTHCNQCRVECALGIDVRSGALDMARFLEIPDEFLA